MRMGSDRMKILMLLGVLVGIPGCVCQGDAFNSLYLADDSSKGLWNAIEDGNLDHVKNFIKCCPHTLDVPYAPFLGVNVGTSLHLAVMRRMTPILVELLKAGADVEAHGPSGNTPLQLAASMGNLPAVEALVMAGADMTARLSWNPSALIIATLFDQPRVVEFLLQQGADPNLPSRSKETALMGAAVIQSVVIAEMLLDAGADIDYQDSQGETALHEAAAYGSEKLMRLLAENGADATIKDKKNRLAGDVICVCLTHGELFVPCGDFQCNPDDIAIVKDVWNEISTKGSGASSLSVPKPSENDVKSSGTDEEQGEQPMENSIEESEETFTGTSNEDMGNPSEALSPAEKLRKTLRKFEAGNKEKTTSTMGGP